ncbi:hypothetical protein B0H14DRAFT_3714701 [Mycena olivaceomarginata]|nr:hypothetical protein B0H14DRAFT_3714701 [Mycena olivaceomarginata]
MPNEFVQRILVPEVGMRLVMEDMDLDGENRADKKRAVAVLRESASYCVAVFPEDGGEWCGVSGKKHRGGDEEALGVVEQMLMERACKHQKELGIEEREEDKMWRLQEEEKESERQREKVEIVKQKHRAARKAKKEAEAEVILRDTTTLSDSDSDFLLGLLAGRGISWDTLFVDVVDHEDGGGARVRGLSNSKPPKAPPLPHRKPRKSSGHLPSSSEEDEVATPRATTKPSYVPSAALPSFRPLDAAHDRADDPEDLPVKHVSGNPPPRTRPRSHSLSGTTELGVLKTVQLHARSCHAFSSLAQVHCDPPPPPVLVHRNSTSQSPSTPASVDNPSRSAPLLFADLPRSRPPTPRATDPVPPQTITSSYPDSPAWTPFTTSLTTSLTRPCTSTTAPSRPCATPAVRASLMQTYNAMLQKQLLPNLHTYFELITAITDRNHEIFTTITALEARAKRGTASTTDAQRIKHLCTENMFDSAMKLFETINTSDGAPHIPLYLYVALLRSCANHMHQDAALHILMALEARKDIKPVASVYKHMIRAYASPTGIADAELIFAEFINCSAKGSIDWTEVYEDCHGPCCQHLPVFNKMMSAYFCAGLSDKAVGALERMMASPAPASTLTVLHLDAVCWAQMLDGLALADHVDELNTLFLTLKQCSVQDGLHVRDADREMVYLANVRHLPSLPRAEQAAETGNFLIMHVLTDGMDVPRLVRPIWEDYVCRGMHRQALAVVASLGTQGRPGLEPLVVPLMQAMLRQKGLEWEVARQVVRLADACGVPVPPEIMVRMLHAYTENLAMPNKFAATGVGPQAGERLALDMQDYVWLLTTAVELEIGFGGMQKLEGYLFKGLFSLSEDMAHAGVGLVDMPPKLVCSVVKTVFITQGTDTMRASFARLGPKFERVLEDPEYAVKALADAASPAQKTEDQPDMSPTESAPVEQLTIDCTLSKQLEVLLRPVNSSAPASAVANEAYMLFRVGLARGKVPTTFVVRLESAEQHLRGSVHGRARRHSRVFG